MKKLTDRQKQAISTKLKITEKAMELFKNKGFEAVKIKDICDSANISVGAFYHYFESKEKMIENAYKQIDMVVAENASTIEYDTQSEKILKMFEKANIFMEKLGWRFIADSYKHIITSNNKYTLSVTRYPYVSIREAFEEGIKNGEFSSNCDAYEASKVCMRTGRGIVFDWCLQEGSYSLSKEIEKAIIMYLKNFKVNQ